MLTAAFGVAAIPALAAPTATTNVRRWTAGIAVNCLTEPRRALLAPRAAILKVILRGRSVWSGDVGAARNYEQERKSGVWPEIFCVRAPNSLGPVYATSAVNHLQNSRLIQIICEPQTSKTWKIPITRLGNNVKLNIYTRKRQIIYLAVARLSKRKSHHDTFNNLICTPAPHDAKSQMLACMPYKLLRLFYHHLASPYFKTRS